MPRATEPETGCRIIGKPHNPDQLTPRLSAGATPEEIGPVLASLNRPFSILADTENGLTVARDHLGLAPLYTAWDENQGWVVADTVGRIIDLMPEAVDDLNDTSVVAHVSGLSSPRRDETFFSRIHPVAPGTVIRFGSENAEHHRYWDPTSFSPDTRVDLQNSSDHLRNLLTEVVGDHTPDTPVAATLSSGMDSTAVLAALAETGADVHAITWTAPDTPEADEAKWARLVADTLQVALTEIPIHTESLLPESGIVTRRSTPLCNMFDKIWSETCRIVATMGRPTLFTGFSGDHLFGIRVSAGADLLLRVRLIRLGRYIADIQDNYSGLTATVRGELASPIARQLMPDLWTRRSTPAPWLHPDRIEIWRDRRRELIGPGLLPGYAERIVGLTEGIIPQLTDDLAATARPHGVDLRHPLLDRRLVEFALTLPSWMLNNGAVDKLVLREAMRDILPEEVTALENILPGEIARKAIRARESQLMSLTRDMRSADLRFVSEPELADYVERFMRGEHGDMSFWNALTFEDWLRRWR